MVHDQEFKYKDGSTVTVSIAEVEGAKETLVFLPALGVRASYYKGFIEETANKLGLRVLTVDWRGHGSSSLRPAKDVDFGYQQLLDDMDELLSWIEEQYPDQPISLGGHSLGGQLSCLFYGRYSDRVKQLLIIASCSVYYKGWSGIGKLRVWMVGKVFYGIARLVGYFPGEQVGFGGREAKGVMKDWGHNATSGKYELAGSSFHYDDAMQQAQPKILAINYKPDTFAPFEATEYLINKFNTNSQKTHLLLPDKTHFNWVKDTGSTLDEVGKWW